MNSRSVISLPYLQGALLLLSVFSLYAGSFHAPFVFDDRDFFESPETLAKYGHAYSGLDFRWLSYATFSWTVNWFGLDVFWLRLGNVLIHGANSIAVFFLLKRLFGATLAESGVAAGVPTLGWYAFFGALIFALHPVNVYGVAYLIQRSTLMATLFVLLMLLAYLEGLLRGGWQWMLAAVVFYIAAILSKEHSVAAPGVALALTFLVRKPSADLLKRIAPYAAVLAIAAGVMIYIAKAKGILGAVYEPNATGILDLSARRQGLTALPNVYLLSILTQGALFFKYLWLWLLPNPGWMSVDMREPFALSLLSWPHTAGFAAFLAYPCIAVWLLLKQGKRGLLGFAMLYPWILFLTELSTVRIQEPFVLYRSYLWMPGLLMALPVMFGWLPQKRAFMLLGAACLLLIPLTMNRLNTFSSALLLWDDAEKLVRDRPNVFGVERVYYNRGTELGQLKRYNEAVANLNRAIAINPYIDLAYGNRATAYFFLGNYPAALNDYNSAISLDPERADNYYNRALIYRALGNFSAAQEDYRKSCKLGVCPKN